MHVPLKGPPASSRDFLTRMNCGKCCGWKHPRAPRMALLFKDERAAKAVLSFLRKTRAGQMVTTPPRDGGGGGEGRRPLCQWDKGRGGRGGGAGPPHPGSLIKGGARGGPPSGVIGGMRNRGGRAFSGLFFRCFFFAVQVHRYAGAPRHDGGSPLRRGNARWGQG